MADITQADLEARFTPRQVQRVFTDDGANTVGPRLELALEEASKIARAILRKSWPGATNLDALIANDASIIGAIATIAMELGANAHPEWQNADGTGPYSKAGIAARATLTAVAAAELRPESEAQAGANPTYIDRVTAPDPNFIFAPVNGKNSGGGF